MPLTQTLDVPSIQHPREGSSRAGDAPELAAGRRRALAEAFDYAGAVYPDEAFRLAAQGVVLVDVRTAEERKFVGFVPGSLHVAWEIGPAQIKNPRFLKELLSKVPKEQVVLFICRSGRRSAEAASAAAKAGYVQAFNVLEGFEGAERTHQ